MAKPRFPRSTVSALGVLASLAAAHPAIVHAASYSASGTHQCKAADGATHSCIVTLDMVGNCVDALSTLRIRDCCPFSRECSHDSQGRETNCREGGASIGFTLNYCIPREGR